MEEFVCSKCKHYFVTWDPLHPKGCKAYSIKTKMIPSVLVKESLGFDCTCFTRKDYQKPKDTYL